MKCVCNVFFGAKVRNRLVFTDIYILQICSNFLLTGMCFYQNLSELPFSMAIALLCLMRYDFMKLCSYTLSAKNHYVYYISLSFSK